MNENEKLAANTEIAKVLGWYLIEPPEEDGTHGFSLREPVSVTRYPWHDTEEEAWQDAHDYFSPDLPIRVRLEMVEALTDEELGKLENLIYNEYRYNFDNRIWSLPTFVLFLDQPTFAKLWCCVKGININTL